MSLSIALATERVPASILRQRLHKLLLDKMRKAGWQTSYLPAVVQMKGEFLRRNFSVKSTKDLSDDQLAHAHVLLLGTAIAPPRNVDSEYLPLTMKQRREIVRLGRYVISKVYGNAWFWIFMPEAVREFWRGATGPDHLHAASGIDMSKRTVHRIHDLTKLEAHYLIQRLEKVETKLILDKRLEGCGREDIRGGRI